MPPLFGPVAETNEILVDMNTNWDVCIVLPYKALEEKKNCCCHAMCQSMGVARSDEDRAAHKKDRKAAKKARKRLVRGQAPHGLVKTEDVDLEDGGSKMAPLEADMQEFTTLIKRLCGAGLVYTAFWSIQGDEIYVKIRCPEDRLEAQADIIDFNMALDEKALDEALAKGFPDFGINPIKIGNECDGIQISSLRPSQYLTTTFDRHPSIRGLYAKVPGTEGGCFRSMHRIKLITDILQTSKRYGGCEIPISKRVVQGRFLAYMPLHDHVERVGLRRLWKEYPVLANPNKMPFDNWRDYYGEDSALYFAFIGHSAIHILWLGLVGIVCELAIDLSGARYSDSLKSGPAGIVRAFYTVFLVLWGIWFCAAWKRAEERYALKWGTTEYESEERPRPQYKGTVCLSPVDGTEKIYFPPQKRFNRIVFGTSIATLMIALDCGFIWLYFYVKTLDPSAAQVMNIVGIQVFTYVYKSIAVKTTEAENWRTETVFSDRLISRLFFFNFVNSYGSLFLNIISVYCVGLCVVDMWSNLTSIMLSTVVTTTLVSILMPLITIRYNRYVQGGYAKDGAMSGPEWQFLLVEYDETLDSIASYTAVSLQFGFLTLFGAAAPITSLFSGIAHVLIIRLDAYKLLSGYRRIEPRGRQDVGMFYEIYRILTFIGAVTNSAIVVFLSEPFRSYSLRVRNQLFIIACFSLLGLATLARALLEKDDPEISLQKKRQTFISDKVVHKIADEDEQISVVPAVPNLNISDKDDSHYTKSLKKAMHFSDEAASS